jgi:2-polyprenyl-3-methyl-5-hydroxy-6-metoxy-1,4-benzoquinol methylase
MSVTDARTSRDEYALGHMPEEYERLRVQSSVWESACGRVLDQVGLAAGASCLDAGCGPGEAMRLMAQRVGSAGRVVGIDVDAPLGAMAQAMLHRSGHRQCVFTAHDVTRAEAIPRAPFDLVYARLLIFHLPQRVAVLRRLWDAVAPGGHLVVQDYDLRTVGVEPPLTSVQEIARVITGAFEAVGCDVRVGARLPWLFEQAGIGAPDGTDVSGRIGSLAVSQGVLRQTLLSLLPAAVTHQVATQASIAGMLEALDRDVVRTPDHPLLWPLLVSSWKRKERT